MIVLSLNANFQCRMVRSTCTKVRICGVIDVNPRLAARPNETSMVDPGLSKQTQRVALAAPDPNEYFHKTHEKESMTGGHEVIV
jgi:hypothetical protein